MRFEPIFQYRIWGGRRLANILTPLPEDETIGEAWLLSDRDDHASVVAEGPLKGGTISQLMEHAPEQMFGKLAGGFDRFPLLLKFLDARDTLSVQVHPTDKQTQYLPAGDTGKTEAWVVLEAGPESRIYAGLNADTTIENLLKSLTTGTITDHLAYFTPKPGDAILIPAGTVHTISDVVVFEVQENSDVTFRLYDWDHIDAKTGKPRGLQVEQAIQCIDFTQSPKKPLPPAVEESAPALREQLLTCKHFSLWRISGEKPFTVGADGEARVFVCLTGSGNIEYEGADYAFSKGDTLLLPATVGVCVCRPQGAVTVLEISLPEDPKS